MAGITVVNGSPEGMRDLGAVSSFLTFYFDGLLGWCEEMLDYLGMKEASSIPMNDSLRVTGWIGCWELSFCGRRNLAKWLFGNSVTQVSCIPQFQDCSGLKFFPGQRI